MRLYLTSVLALLLATTLAAKLPVSPDQAQPMAVGTMTPTVTVQDATGHEIDLLSLLREKPTVLIFYRGGWCPFCNRHLGELAAIEPDLAALGFRVIALSPESPSTLQKLAAKAEPSANRLVLSDRNMHAAAAFGVAYEMPTDLAAKYTEHGIDLAPVPGDATHYWLPVPAAFVIDQKGMVTFAHANPDYKVRIEPANLLAAARASNSN